MSPKIIAFGINLYTQAVWGVRGPHPLPFDLSGAHLRATLTLRTIAFDTQPIESGATSATLFVGSDQDVADSAATKVEQELVRWLSGDHHIRDFFLSELSLSTGAWIDMEIKAPFISASNSKPGDIDLLACERGSPQFATAIEWKRVKVRCDGDVEKVNRIEVLRKAIEQVDGLYALGFHKTFLGVIVIVDASASNQASFLFRGASNDTCHRVIDTAGMSVPEKAGLLYVEIAQPLHRSINDAATVGIATIKPASPREQPAALSQMVERYFSGR